MAEAQDVHHYGTVIGRMVRNGPIAVTFESSEAGMARFGTRNLLDGKAAGIGSAHTSLAALGPVPGVPPRR